MACVPCDQLAPTSAGASGYAGAQRPPAAHVSNIHSGVTVLRGIMARGTNTESPRHHGDRWFSRISVWHGNRATKRGEAVLAMRLLAYLALLCQSGALFTIPPSEKVYDVIITPFVATTETSTPAAARSSPETSQESHTTEQIRTRIPHSSLITMAPLSRNPLELRQKCFNDQGFSVDCATWTGYYYTWGPPGDEYSGGPGDDGHSDSNVAYVSDAAQSIMPLAISYIILMNLITLWAALSLA